MHNVSEITSINSMSNLRFAEHVGGQAGLDRRFADLLRGLTFKDLADEIDGDDPDMKLLLPTVGLVKTNLWKQFEKKYTLYF